MCGICGAAGPSASSIPVRKMCRLVRHRGPDEERIKVLDSRIVFGHTRLSIIDLERGSQPICNEDDSICIVFNGEIYNYIELRRELASKHEFRTKSDTEAIIHAYEEWGLGFIHKLRGMFAFALYDSNRHLLILARDRLGKKPLYYTLLHDATLVFASELLSFKPLYGGSFPTEMLDMESIAYYLYYGYVPQPRTVIQGVYTLPPSTLMLYDIRSGGYTLIHYWEPLLGEGQVLTNPSDTLYSLIHEAIRIRLRSDVPISILLSSGLDSGTVASIAMREWSKKYERGLLGYKLRAVTVGFPGTPYDEAELARKTADFIGIDHIVVDVDIDKALNVIDVVITGFDQPFADTSMIPTYIAFSVARQYSKVALTGDGGDEVFLGYPWMLQPCQTPLSTRLVKLQNIVAEILAHKRRALSGASKLAGGLFRYYNTYLRFDKRWVSRLTGLRPRAFNELSRLVERRLPTCIDRVNYATLRFYLLNDILVKVDRSSMLVSLEARSPLLDQELVQLVGSIPASQRYGGEPKRLLKMVIKRFNLLPPEVLKQHKRGFGAPIEYWIQNIDVERAAAIVEKYGFHDVSTLIRKLRESKTSYYHATLFFTIYSLGKWLDAHVG